MSSKKFWKIFHLRHTVMPRPPQALYFSYFLLVHLFSIAAHARYTCVLLFTLLCPCFRLQPSLMRHPQLFVYPFRRHDPSIIFSLPQIHLQCHRGAPHLLLEARDSTVNLPKILPVKSISTESLPTCWMNHDIILYH